MSETIDSTAEEIGTEIVHPDAPATLFRTDDPVQVVERATAVANALKDLIDKQGLTQSIQGKPHVRVEGWQALGAMLGVTAVCVATEPVDGGWKATVEARTLDGRVLGCADALCTKHEKRGPWKSADDYARLSMAQTRATSKALKGPLGFVVSLAGYATTPAEEMTFVEPDVEVRVEDKPVTDVGRERILMGIVAANLEPADVMKAVGMVSLDDVKTVGDALRVRAAVDGMVRAGATDE